MNVMLLVVWKKINGQPKPTAWEFIQLGITSVKVVGEMRNVLIRLSANNKICQFINIVVADIPDGYGLILSRDWSTRLKWYFASDWSHLWLPHKGITNRIKFLREPSMKHNITKLEEGNESTNSVLGNHLTELELRYHTLGKANNMTDIQPDLLQLSQADEIDCKLVDMVSVLKIAELDHG